MKFFRQKKWFKYMLFPLAAAIISGIVASSILSIAKTNNIIDDGNLNTNNESSNKQAQSKQSLVAKAISSSTFSREISNPTINTTNPWTSSVRNVTYVNGNNQPVLVLNIDSAGNVFVSSPNPLKIECVNDVKSISSDDFEISFTSYNAIPYDISGANNGYKLATSDTKNISWIVNNETYFNPYIDANTVKNNIASSYVYFDSIKSGGIALGNVSSGFGVFKLHLKLPSTNEYNGANVIKIAPNKEYSDVLGKIDSANYLNDTLILTPLDKGKIYFPDSSITSAWHSKCETDFSTLASSNTIAASDYLNKLNDALISVNLSGYIYDPLTITQNNKILNPKIVAYANDNEGIINFVCFNPYTIEQKNGKLDLSIEVNDPSNPSSSSSNPTIYTLSGFKKQVAGSIGTISKTLNIDQFSSSYFDHSTNKTKFLLNNSSNTEKLNFGFPLSPLSYFDFSVDNSNLNINLVKPGSNLVINNLFKNNALLNWDLIRSRLFSANNNVQLQSSLKSNNFLPTLGYASAYFNLNERINQNIVAKLYKTNTDGGYYDPLIEGPLVVSDRTINPSSTSNDAQFVNILNYYDANKITINNQTQIEQIRNFCKLRQFFSTPLPRLKSSAGLVDYSQNLSNYFIDKKTSKSSIEPQLINNNNLIYFENGPVISLRNYAGNPVPFLYDATSVFAWERSNSSSSSSTCVSLENPSIFSSKENYDWNVNQYNNNTLNNFGRTTFEIDPSSITISNNVLPSSFINTGGYKTLKIHSYNSLLANNDNSYVTFTADDINGTLKIEITPYVLIEPNKNLVLSNSGTVDQFIDDHLFEILTSEVRLNNDPSRLVKYTWTLSGFKKTGGTSTTASVKPRGYPTTAFVTSSLLGTDIEANLDRLGTSVDATNFKNFIIADAIESLKKQNLLSYYDSTNVGQSINLIVNDKGDEKRNVVDQIEFDKVISWYKLISKDKYNSYVFDVAFKPSTLVDFYGNYNINDVTIRLTISTTGAKTNSWIANDYISTGLSKAYDYFTKNPSEKPTSNPITDPITSKIVTKNDFINNFANELIKNNPNKNLLRFYQNQYYDNINAITSLKNNSLKDILDIQIPNSGRPYNIYPRSNKKTNPLIYNYAPQYGFMYNGLKKSWSWEFNSSIQDFSNWSFSLSNLSNFNSGSFILNYQPKIWFKEGKFIENNIEEKTIRFADVTESIGKTTMLDISSLEAIDTSINVETLAKDISNPSSVNYTSYLNLIKARIENLLPDASNPNLKSNISLELNEKLIDKTNPTTVATPAYKDSIRDGILPVDVYVTGDYYNGDSTSPINTTTKKLLGTVNIINLKKAQITRFNSSFVIPNINQYQLPSNLAQYWSEIRNTLSPNAFSPLQTIYKNATSPGLVNDLNKVITEGLLIDEVINSSNNTCETEINYNLDNLDYTKVDNSTGTIELDIGKVEFSGIYYDELGTKRDTKNGGAKPITNTSTIYLSGFDKIYEDKTSFYGNATSPTTPVNITINEFTGRAVNSITDQEIIKALITNDIIKNFPFYKYGVLDKTKSNGASLTISDLITINNKQANLTKGTLQFDVTVNEFITDKYLSANGQHSRKIIIVDEKASTNPPSPKQTFIIDNLLTNATNKATGISQKGLNCAEFSNFLLSAQGIVFNELYSTLSSPPGIDNTFIDLLRTKILTKADLIQNRADGTNVDNIGIIFNRIDNTQGMCEITLVLNKFITEQKDQQGNPTGVFNEVNSVFPQYTQAGNITSSPNFLSKSNVILTGFKKIPGQTDINKGLNTVGNVPSINVSVDDPKKLYDTTNPSNNPTPYLKDLVYENLPCIFDNLPSFADNNLPLDKNNPVIKPDDLIIANPNKQNDYIEVDISLKSYYVNENIATLTTPVWKYNLNKSFGKVRLVFNNNSNTELINTIYLNPIVNVDEQTLSVETASNVCDNIGVGGFFETAIKELIINRAISGYVPANLNTSNISIDVWTKQYDNIQGWINFDFTLDTYYSNGTLINSNSTSGSTNQPKKINLTIYGFKKVKPTSILLDYDGSADSSINSKFAYEYTNEDICKLAYNTLISNTPDNFSINDINVISTSCWNKNGQLQCYIEFSKYFDSQGVYRDSKKLADITISGFKKLGTQTTIASRYYVDQNYQTKLAISLLDYTSAENIAPTNTLKNFILSNLIINKPVGLTVDDFDVTGIVVNNINGTIQFNVSLYKYIDNAQNIIDTRKQTCAPLNAQVTVLGFLNNGATDISPILYVNENIGASEFANKQQDLKNFIFNQIQNKWDADTSVNFKAFDINDFKIYNVKPNNITGEISLQVGLYRYIDNNGQFVIIKGNKRPCLFDVVIKGFNQVQSSFIISNFKILDKTQIIATDYINSPNFNTEISQMIFDYLLVNKIPTTSINDIKLGNRVENNNLGTISVDVTWTNNYMDSTGQQVTSGSNNGPSTTIIFSGFKQISSPTAQIQSKIDMSAVQAPDNNIVCKSVEASDFAQVVNVKNEDLIKDKILNNLSNLPQASTKADIKILVKRMSDGKEYFGDINNITGQITVTYTLKKYFYGSNCIYVDCDKDPNTPPFKDTIVFSGFKTATTDTADVTDWDLSNDKSDNDVAAIIRNTASDFVVSDEFKYLFMKYGNVTNWKPLDDIIQKSIAPGSSIQKQDYLNLQYNDCINNGLFSKIIINVLKYDNRRGQVKIQVRLYGTRSSTDGIYVQQGFGTPVNVNLSGFRKISDISSSINTTISIKDKQINENLSKYNSGTNYKDINVFDLTDNDIKTIVWANLYDSINNQQGIFNTKSAITPIIESNVINAPSFGQSEFDKYFKVTLKNRSSISTGTGGFMLVTLEMYNFYTYISNNLTYVNGDVNHPYQSPVGQRNIIYTVDITINGFKESVITKINNQVNLPSNKYNHISPNVLANQNNDIKTIICDNKDLFFVNLPEYEKDTSILYKLWDHLIITVNNFNNLDGSLNINIQLDAYYNDIGEYVDKNGKPYSQDVVILGFKITYPTSVKSTIDISNWSSMSKSLFDVNDVDIKQNIWQNPTDVFVNIVNDKLDFNDFNVSIIDSSRNFTNGSISIIITLNKFYNDDGIAVENAQTKSFTTTLIGFNKICTSTKIATEYNISHLSFSKFTPDDIANNPTNLNINDITIADYNKMFTVDGKVTLPENFKLENVLNVEFVAGSENNSAGTIEVDITINNWFEQIGNNVTIQDTSKTFRTTFSGFQKVAVTKAKENVRLSISQYSALASTNLVQIAEQVKTSNGSSSIIETALNTKELKEKIIENPVINTSNGVWETGIHVEKIDIDGPNGELTVKGCFDNLVYAMDATTHNIVQSKVSINPPVNKVDFSVVIDGFTPVLETKNTLGLLSFSDSGKTIKKASEFASNIDQVKEFLKERRNKLFTQSNGGDKLVNIIKVVNPETPANTDVSNPKLLDDRIFVDDSQGVIKLKFVYSGGYDAHATNIETNRLSQEITITDFLATRPNSFKASADCVRSSNGIYTLTYNDPNYANIEVDNLTFNLQNEVNRILEASINNSNNSESDDVKNYTPNLDWASKELDSKNGTIIIRGAISNWRETQNNTNGTLNKAFTNNSVFVKEDAQISIKIVLKGFKKIDLQKTETNLNILIGLTVGLGAIIIIAIILILFLRRRMI